MQTNVKRHRVVIVGSGFGGLNCAKKLKHSDVDLTIVDRRNYHLFQPLLYQVASGSLSAGDIATPIRSEFVKHPEIKVLQSEVVDFDVAEKVILTIENQAIPYDTLVLATGSSHSYFGHDEWAKAAPGLKTVEDALEIRGRILRAFEAAERTASQTERKALLTFVLVGGGPTGVELAGTLGELAHQTMKGEFRNFQLSDVRILLVEHGDRLIQAFDPHSSSKAEQYLQGFGVEVWAGANVINVDPFGVDVQRDGAVDRIQTRTVLWAAGNMASPLGKLLAEKTGATIDRGGRISVDDRLNIADHPEIFVLGDLAHFPTADGRGLPALAPVAMQQGSYAAKVIIQRMKCQAVEPFRYFDKGILAVVGRNKAVAEIFGVKFSGLLAWLIWVFVHLASLIEYSNRILVLVQWAVYYFTRRRGARLITGEGMLHPANATGEGAPPGALPETSGGE